MLLDQMRMSYQFLTSEGWIILDVCYFYKIIYVKYLIMRLGFNAILRDVPYKKNQPFIQQKKEQGILKGLCRNT